jgi:uncharacterized protein YjeT (DUF2065 family)
MSGSAVFLCVLSTKGAAGMDMEIWHQLAVALALVFVIEGMVPFLAPSRWRDMVRILAQLDDRTMRSMGLFSMALGLGLLYLFN